MDVNGPIQVLELDADGTAVLKIRNAAGRGHKWTHEPPTTDLDAAVRRFLEVAPGYVLVKPTVAHVSAWRRIFGGK